MAGVQDLRRLTWMDRWHELAGYARIEPMDAADAVVQYVSKYVVKGGEIDMGGPLVPAVFPLFPEAASRPGDHEAGSEAGSVKAGAATPEGLGLDGFCRATTLFPAWLGRKADMT
jgi:hypothetical protein